MIDKDRVLEWDSLISRAARFVSHDFPDVDRNDLSQEVWEYILGRHELDLDHPGIYKALITVSKRTAWKIRKQNLRSSVQYSYRPSDVRNILEEFYDYQDWERGWCPGDAHDEDSRGNIDVRVDVRIGLEKIPKQYRAAIENRYRDGVRVPGDSAARKQLDRAVIRLTDALNSYHKSSAIHGHPGRRDVISNATARFRIEENQ